MGPSAGSTRNPSNADHFNKSPTTSQRAQNRQTGNGPTGDDIAAPLDAASTEAGRQTSPGKALFPSRFCRSDIRPCVPYKYGTLKICDFSSRMDASYPLPVRRASVSPAASFRFHLAMDTLAVRLVIPLVGLTEDLHLQGSAPCRAHTTKKPRLSAGLSGKEQVSRGGRRERWGPGSRCSRPSGRPGRNRACSLRPGRPPS